MQRFDEVLLQKASKISMDEMRENLRNYITVQDFSTTKQMIDTLKNETRKEVFLINQKISDSMNETKQYITDIVSKLAKESKDQILSSLGGKPVEPAEMMSFLHLKADKDSINHLDTVKADRTDVKTTNSMLEVLHNQINHI